MSADPTPGPFRYADGFGVRAKYRALARRARDEAAARAGDAMMRANGQVRSSAAGAGRHRAGNAPPDRRGSRPCWEALPADEVAIDFPSMAPVVARMLEAFFAETDDRNVTTRRAEVELTARQADRGVRVPLDLTVQHTCPACGGRGELWADPCGLCDGSGAGLLSHRLHFRVPPGVRHGTRLRYSVTPPHAFETHIEVRIAVQ